MLRLAENGKMLAVNQAATGACPFSGAILSKKSASTKVSIFAKASASYRYGGQANLQAGLSGAKRQTSMIGKAKYAFETIKACFPSIVFDPRFPQPHLRSPTYSVFRVFFPLLL